MIFSSAHMDDPNIVRLAEEEYPIVMVNRRTYHPIVKGKVDYVGVDNILGGYLAVEHLIKLGHQKIGVMGGSSESSVSFERLEGGKRAMEAYGVQPMAHYFLEGDFLKKSGYQGGMRFLEMGDPPSAIFAANDYMALGVYQAFVEKGLKVPEDVAIVGFNDIEFTAVKGVELTTVGQRKYEMGTLAVKALIEKIEGKRIGPAKEIFLEPELVIRRTCGFHLRGYQMESRSRNGVSHIKSGARNLE